MRKIVILFGVFLAIFVLYVLQKSLPTYDDITSPVVVLGKAGEKVTARNFELTVKQLRYARKIKLTAFGNERSYGGADWRLEGLYQLVGQDMKSAYILAEFEAKIDDPEAFAAGACQIALTERGETRWSPQILPPYEVRKARPSLDERSTCGGATIKPLKAGATVKMAEIFRAPADTTKFDLAISWATLRPRYLSLR